MLIPSSSAASPQVLPASTKAKTCFGFDASCGDAAAIFAFRLCLGDAFQLPNIMLLSNSATCIAISDLLIQLRIRDVSSFIHAQATGPSVATLEHKAVFQSTDQSFRGTLRISCIFSTTPSRMQMLVAILILSLHRREIDLFSSFIQGVTELDSALGKEVGLFLFYPRAQTSLMAFDKGHHFLAGERIEPKTTNVKTYRAVDFFANVDPSSYGSNQSQIELAVSRSSVAIVPEFCRIFDVDETDSSLRVYSDQRDH